MTRAEYFAELDSHLITLPKEERDMAVGFYEEYFEDAGPEKEQEVMEELGKPYNLARTIIGETSLYSKSEVYIKYKESKPMPQNTTGVFASLKKPEAFENIDHTSDVMPPRAQQEQAKNGSEEDVMPNRTMPPHQDDAIKMYGANASGNEEKTQNTAYSTNSNTNTNQSGNVNFDPYYTHAGENNYTPPPQQEQSGMSAGWIVFWVLISVFFIVPVVIPTAFAIIVAMLGISLASIACIVVAIIAFVTGLLKFAVSIPWAVGLICISAVSLGIGFIMLSASLAFFFKFLPWLIRKIWGLFIKRRTA
ncbi:MAG: DUF1700 domain-containing protein [Oscillospiraceae bacterium]|nr:DUF1700 domain-containing protein [Oscillospiraceae bacterium]